jgi:hypothetical protein
MSSTTSLVTYANLGHWLVDTTLLQRPYEVHLLRSHNVECEPETDDSTVRLKSARMSVVGFLSEPPPVVARYVRYREAKEPYTFWPDYDFSLEGPFQITESTPLACLLGVMIVYPNSDTSYFSLILRCLNEKDQIYERIGVVQHGPPDEILNTREKSQITIVEG